jgi:hypothetical protein
VCVTGRFPVAQNSVFLKNLGNWVAVCSDHSVRELRITFPTCGCVVGNMQRDGCCDSPLTAGFVSYV